MPSTTSDDLKTHVVAGGSVEGSKLRLVEERAVDPRVLEYLREVIQKVSAGGELKVFASNDGVCRFAADRVNGVTLFWVSKEVLRWVETENELAAVFGLMATEPEEGPWEGAVRRLYDSGYDPRGVLQLVRRLVANPRLSQYDQEVLRESAEKVRLAISEQSPLRNPIVRSPRFVAIKPRLSAL